MSKRSDQIKKKAKFIRVILLIVGLITTGVILYTGASVYSIVQSQPTIDDSPVYSYNDNGTPLDANDDTIDYTVNISLANNGFFDVKYLKFAVDVYLHETDYSPGLLDPEITTNFMGSGNTQLSTIEPGQTVTEELTIHIDVDDPGLALALLTEDGTLRFEFDVETQVQYFPINISGSFFSTWEKQVP